MTENDPNDREKTTDIQDWKSPHIAGWGVIALIFCLVAIDVLIGFDPKLNEWEHASAIVRNLLLVVGGVIGFVVALKRIRQTDEQISQANNQIQIAKLEADGRENERVRESFQQAVAMLYGEEDETKPFAITQLRRIALDRSDQYLEQAIVLLCGYGRKHASNRNEGISDEEIIAMKRRPFELATECINLVFKLATEFEAQGRGKAPIDLKNTNLRKCAVRGITLSEENIRGSDLQYTRFENCKFVGLFGKDTSFVEVTFHEVVFERAYFKNCNFEGADFFYCTLQFSSWRRCDFSYGTHHATNVWVGSNRTFIQCDFSDCLFGSSDADQAASEDKRGFLVNDFLGCFSNLESPPRGLEENDPPMKVNVAGRHSGGKHNLIFSEGSIGPHIP